MKTLFSIVLVLFYMNVYSQTLSFEEIIHIRNHKDLKKYMTSKSFRFFSYQVEHEEDVQMYIINKGTDKEESIILRSQQISYQTKNSAFVKNLVKQIQSKYPIVTNYEDSIYRFGDTHTVITATIYKKPNGVSFIIIYWK
ncbi:hypothetical protein [Mucilaginibacter sp. BT774]|uniref:hypothetical protein n=1 Tax=Mucilaginibacter sp. BT774 TaxID=3062276 RepID=UPI002675EF8F|nr:hypothetical protein [Mucilaginibacter sp. BT774]MDO3628139.1 hypothetical protein [Mucilaginibacter sp. BT774]